MYYSPPYRLVLIWIVSLILSSCNAENGNNNNVEDAGDDAGDSPDASSDFCQPTAVWGTSFELGESVENFELNGLFDGDEDGFIDQDPADFNLEDVFCHGYKSVILITSTFS